MKHLSALDALFLQLETPDTPMHVGSLMLLDRPPAGRDPYAAIRAHIAKRIHLAPVFSRVLRFMPLDIASPLWVPAERVDLDYHIQRVTLFRTRHPGSARARRRAPARGDARS